MGLTIIEASLRGAAVATFVLLSIMFARDWNRALTARLGALLTLGGAAYVVLIGIAAILDFTNLWRLPVHILSLASPPLFWLFAASWFDDEWELRWWHWLFVALTVIAGLTANFLYWNLHMRLFALAFVWRGFSVVSILLALRATISGWTTDLVESRRRVRIVIVAAVSISIFLIVVAEWNADWPPPPAWRITNALGMLVLAAIVALATLGWRDPALVVPPAKPNLAAPRPEADDSGLLARLDTDMRHERLYRQDGLTITAVAARLGVPEYRLRRAINQGLGARNFNAYLNGFRLDEARQALADPEQREVPILTIALDAGFGSLAPFNRAFREAEGCTPSDYRARKTLA